MTFSTIAIVALALALQTDEGPNPCSDCHSPARWIPLAESMPFKHNQTSFMLDGKHKLADCIQCHTGQTVEQLHQFDQAESECFYCHMDFHLSEFGTDCGRCHGMDTWEMANWRREHETTLFPLRGVHAILDCSVCHGTLFSTLRGNMSTECVACHESVYAEVIAGGTHPDNVNCILCHNSQAWLPIDMAHHDLIFPIYSSKHRGEWSTCSAECHPDVADYSIFSCGLNEVCHEHRKSKMDDEHDDVRKYAYDDQACYDCHPRGEADD